jgi:hypothetical protein
MLAVSPLCAPSLKGQEALWRKHQALGSTYAVRSVTLPYRAFPLSPTTPLYSALSGAVQDHTDVRQPTTACHGRGEMGFVPCFRPRHTLACISEPQVLLHICTYLFISTAKLGGGHSRSGQALQNCRGVLCPTIASSLFSLLGAVETTLVLVVLGNPGDLFANLPHLILIFVGFASHPCDSTAHGIPTRRSCGVQEIIGLKKLSAAQSRVSGSHRT